jgi:1-acyl-sn-glycerol-3-phosphate acyltransferase
LLELRKLPKYTFLQKVIQVIYFLIFGIPKIVAMLFFLPIGPSIFMLLCFIWRTMGRPAGFRTFIQLYYSIIARIFLFILGFHKVVYNGKIDSDARFVVTNHVTFFDGWFFIPFKPRPLAKKELFSWPIMGDMLDIYEGIAVDRSKHSGVTQQLRENALDSSKPPATLAPEGATTSGEYMFKFHLGAFLSDLPVQPVAIRYTMRGTDRRIAHLSFFHHSLWHLLIFFGIPSIKVDMTFMEPMSLKTDGKDDPRTFADATQLRIANFLGVKAIDQSNSAIFNEQAKKKAIESEKEKKN